MKYLKEIFEDVDNNINHLDIVDYSIVNFIEENEIYSIKKLESIFNIQNVKKELNEEEIINYVFYERYITEKDKLKCLLKNENFEEIYFYNEKEKNEIFNVLFKLVLVYLKKELKCVDEKEFREANFQFMNLLLKKRMIVPYVSIFNEKIVDHIFQEEKEKMKQFIKEKFLNSVKECTLYEVNEIDHIKEVENLKYIYN